MIINKELVSSDYDSDYPYIDYTITRVFLVTEQLPDGRIIKYETKEVT